MQVRDGRCHWIGDASDDALIGELASGRVEALSVLYLRRTWILALVRHRANGSNDAVAIEAADTADEPILAPRPPGLWTSRSARSRAVCALVWPSSMIVQL
jgi:hypothetical protein